MTSLESFIVSSLTVERLVTKWVTTGVPMGVAVLAWSSSGRVVQGIRSESVTWIVVNSNSVIQRVLFIVAVAVA